MAIEGERRVGRKVHESRRIADAGVERLRFVGLADRLPEFVPNQETGRDPDVAADKHFARRPTQPERLSIAQRHGAVGMRGQRALAIARNRIVLARQSAGAHDLVEDNIDFAGGYDGNGIHMGERLGRGGLRGRQPGALVRVHRIHAFVVNGDGAHRNAIRRNGALRSPYFGSRNAQFGAIGIFPSAPKRARARHQKRRAKQVRNSCPFHHAVIRRP
ncbi:MAG: hypothetical protein BWZ10_03469 [candidate division BRC1 bacterium ADurb.BinA364]|nr:MAG: hypothetical protein BWZ10_03469 [candidate division BRC1 bacterium ADurb.BinA364]